MANQTTLKTKDKSASGTIYFQSFYVVGFKYHEGPLAFSKLKIGSKLKLIAEPDNRFDYKAVAIYRKKLKLGYVPRNENKYLSRLLEANQGGILECWVTSLNQACHHDERIEVVVRMRVNGEEKTNDAD
jgi:hypothetical protein